MDAQTKNEIIAEITATSVKTIEQTVRESLKRTLYEDFVDKTTDETVKRIKISIVPEFKNKGNKIRYEANNTIMEKIDEAISAIEKGKIERCQEKLAEGKKIIPKQQKVLRITDREERTDRKSSNAIYQTILLPIQRMKNSSLELVGKQLQTKIKGKQISKKTKRNSFGMPPSPKKFRNL